MTNDILKSIKHSSIISIFNAIASGENTSRAQISTLTGLSLMTVGKIADSLIDLGIVTQDKQILSHAGRRAGVMNVNKNKYAIILDISAQPLTLTLYDLKLSQIDTISFPLSNGENFSRRISRFFEESRNFIEEKYSISDCIGVGIIVPGAYIKEKDRIISDKIMEMNIISPYEYGKQCFNDTNIIVDSHINASSVSSVSEVDGYLSKTVLYMYFDNSTLGCAYYLNGNMLRGKDMRTCNIGQMIFDHGTTVEERFSLCKSEEECTTILCKLLFNLTSIVYPDTIILENNSRFPSSNIKDFIINSLISEYKINKDSVPEIHESCSEYKSSHRGLAMLLREQWVSSIILDNRIK